MSHLKQFCYPGWGTWAEQGLNYAQAVRVGDRILCSGQGGWDGKASDFTLEGLIEGDLNAEIDRAFENCELNLKHAGGKGWSQVYKVVTYSTDIPSQHERIVYNLKKWMPDHKAIWTEVGVKELGSDKMHFEIDVEAHDDNATSKAA